MGGVRATVLAGHPDVEELVIASRDGERGRLAADPLGARSVTQEQLLDEELDGLVICTETAAHSDLILAGAERGLPMFCEKPIAVDVDESEHILEQVEAVGATLQIGFHRRFDPAIREARGLARGGDLGELYLVRMASYDHEPSPERYIPASGGIWRDLHVHDFDLARWLTGLEVETVYAQGAVRGFERFARYGDLDTTAAVLTMDGGLPVVITGARHDPRGYDVRLEILGSKDSVVAGSDSKAPLLRLEQPEMLHQTYEGFVDRFEEAFKAETESFVDVIRGAIPNPCPGSTAVAAVQIAAACERSVRSAQPVHPDRAGRAPLGQGSPR
jgi:myo-inositol 2-dehydrogenase/D-chiro-inositol 1-dehydrogenase